MPVWPKSPDGKADMLEVKDVRGQALRLFVDQQTHLPLMLSFQEVRPRMMIEGGPGGRRGPGGPGGPRGPMALPQWCPAPAPLRRWAPGGSARARKRFGGAWSRCRHRRRAPSDELRRLQERRRRHAPAAAHAVTVDGKPVEEWTLEKVKVNPALKADFFDKK